MPDASLSAAAIDQNAEQDAMDDIEGVAMEPIGDATNLVMMDGHPSRSPWRFRCFVQE